MKNEIQDRKNIFWFLTISIFFCLGLYVYFVSHTVYSVVQRGQTEKAIATLENSTNNMESQYVALKGSVTSDLARSKGFTQVATAKYISRDSSAQALSLNSQI